MAVAVNCAWPVAVKLVVPDTVTLETVGAVGVGVGVGGVATGGVGDVGVLLVVQPAPRARMRPATSMDVLRMREAEQETFRQRLRVI
jgi:hypothetical protein